MLIHKPCGFVVGDTWQIQGNLFYADGTPFNLGVGCIIQWRLDDAAGNRVITLSLAGGGGIQVLDAVNGICFITVSPSQTGNLAVGQYTDQLRATDPSGYVSSQWQGIINAKTSLFIPP